MSKKFKNLIITLVVIALLSGWKVLDSYLMTPSPVPSSSPVARASSTPRIAHVTKKPVKTVSPSADVLGESDSHVTPPPDGFVNEGGVVRQHAKVVRVVDGDTIEIEGGKTVRYIGMDTPETVKPNTPVQCYGKEASEKNKELVEGKEIAMEKDVSETDRYGRLLRYVFVDGVFVNDYLVKEGYAYSSAYPPDVKFQDMFRDSQKEAQEQKQGLWGAGCPVSKQK
jgi:endonuclease YncB( thermonuclease family)